MTRTALDQFIIDVNAIDECVRHGGNLDSVTARAALVWDTVTTDRDKEDIREVYRPAFNRAAARILHDAAKEVAVTDDGSVVDTYRSEFADHIDALAARHEP